MALIEVKGLTFCYEGSSDNVFENVSFKIDSDWRLGLVGRNGRGKTTLLRLLSGKFEYSGQILGIKEVCYFPYEVDDKGKNAYEIAAQLVPDHQQWLLDKELNLLQISDECRSRPFCTLSGGEQTKILLAILFLHDESFLLIDEPTNHLDGAARRAVSKYLSGKNSFILVSHDRNFLDGCVDHILSINKADIEVQSGNLSSWLANKEYDDSFKRAQNERLAGEIDRLKQAARQKSNWADAAEKKKKGAGDKGFMGAKAARQMKTAKIIERRKQKAIEDKSMLLKNVESDLRLQIMPQQHFAENLVVTHNLQAFYDNKAAFSRLSLCIKQGQRCAVVGKNGSGKSTLLKLIAGQSIDFKGTLSIASQLKISYVPQDTSFLRGDIKQFAAHSGIDQALFLSMLHKLDFDRKQFFVDLSQLSAGQKKKVLIAKSMCERAHLYVWDEPLNYVDIISRMQIERLILECSPTLLFVEHDEAFCTTVSTDIIAL